MGNREVPRIDLLMLRGHLRGALAEACHGFPRATEPKAEEAV
jgi:hypothetical protein